MLAMLKTMILLQIWKCLVSRLDRCFFLNLKHEFKHFKTTLRYKLTFKHDRASHRAEIRFNAILQLLHIMHITNFNV